MATLEELTTKISSQFDEQNKSIDKLKTDISAVVDAQAKITKSLDDMPAVYPAGFNPKTHKIAAVPIDHEADEMWGYKSFGDFAVEVVTSRKRGSPTERMQKSYSQVEKVAQGMGELVGSDGGFLVPPTFSNNIFTRVYSNDLLKRTDQYTISGNSIVFPRNAETSRATGSRYGGVQAYWRQEGASPTLSKPTFGRLTLTLHKLIALAAITDELMEDSPTVMTQYLNRAFGDEITFLIGDAIVNGTGAGQPLGILNQASLVTVSKETGQAAATINTQNITNMWARLYAPCRANAVWLINQDTEPQLLTLTLGIGTAGVATYMPPGGLSGAPYATILGRPVVPTEFNATLGTVGDIILADLSHYVTAVKGGGFNTAVSMHLYFDTHEQAFRITYRIDGQSWWPAALTPYKGSNTQSHIVALATRA